MTESRYSTLCVVSLSVCARSSVLLSCDVVFECVCTSVYVFVLPIGAQPVQWDSLSLRLLIPVCVSSRTSVAGPTSFVPPRDADYHLWNTGVSCITASWPRVWL